jgi:hypothetical protein
MDISTPIQAVALSAAMVICAGVVVKSIRQIWKFIRMTRSGERALATITDFKEQKSDDGVTYPAIVSFTTQTGQKITANSKHSFGFKPTVGKEVWIVYSIDDPTDFFFLKSVVPFFNALTIVMLVGAIIYFCRALSKLV